MLTFLYQQIVNSMFMRYMMFSHFRSKNTWHVQLRERRNHNALPVFCTCTAVPGIHRYVSGTWHAGTAVDY